MRWSHALLPLTAAVARAAINVDGLRVTQPVSEDDPSPIADPLTYIPDQHDCPLPCEVDYANVHRWVPYLSTDRLRRCELPMLLHFSVQHALDDPGTDVLIRACTLGANPGDTMDRTVSNATSMVLDNPKNATDLFEVSLDVAPACAINGRKTKGKLSFETGGGQESSGISHLLDGMEDFFRAQDNCDETYLFGYHKKTVTGLYIGPGLGKPTVTSTLQAVSGRLLPGGYTTAQQTVAQICSRDTGPETAFGLFIDTAGDLARVQEAAVGWSRGNCASGIGSSSSTSRASIAVTVYDIASAPLEPADGRNGTASIRNTDAVPGRLPRRRAIRPHPGLSSLQKRATCRYIRVEAGDGCASLAVKCGIRGADFLKFNAHVSLCSAQQLRAASHVCCSAGDQYTESKPGAPKPNADGTCSSHLITNVDTCDKLATQFGLTVGEIESFNKGKTWGWTVCERMLAGYNMCLSTGLPPLPPPQQGTECGPQVPGTKRSDTTTPMTDLNPCPLKACCSNWGFCGPFPVHCDINALPGGGPGTKLPDAPSTCISNCGNEIKQNSGPPAVFSRIGYYESWNMGRKCLRQSVENANTDGSYTHMHWGFLEIDPTDWTIVIKDPHKQWDAFKKLQNIKKIVSFGGWAYSTEEGTYNIIRDAIVKYRETFATNAAKFIMDQGLDGIDIDWEYPGAPDIYVNGAPIGQPSDGVSYLRFLTVLKSKLPNKSVSIAAPASYWYLKAFPIDRIAAAIDYIVYMTYDLHGQWDYGNPNAFDSCPSGKCIRSHVNLTETLNTLAIVTKAGVPNNKIFVGESSYGRSFRMAVDGCWGPMCEFTGSRLVSDANPGRCTDTAGYISNAEINELIQNGNGRVLYDRKSDTDVLLYNGDYVSYMTPKTKMKRREDWRKLNFAGSIDWAVDLQAFGQEDAQIAADRPTSGEEGCVMGEGRDLSWDELCAFTCNYGFCPETVCFCTLTNRLEPLPPVRSTGDFVAWNEFQPDLQRLCKFACKYGYCPDLMCGVAVVDEWEDGSVDSGQSPDEQGGLWDKAKNHAENSKSCRIYKTGQRQEVATLADCYPQCRVAIEEAKAEGRMYNYGCVGFWPLDKPIPWTPFPSSSDPNLVTALGKCSCDNMLVNSFADLIIDALPIIAQIGCFILMSAVKLVLDIGLAAIPGVGRILDAGLDAATTAAQVVAYAYPEGENPVGAFEWWLSPCGGSDLVPAELKRVFDILSAVAGGVSSFVEPKNIKKHSGKKGLA